MSTVCSQLPIMFESQPEPFEHFRNSIDQVINIMALILSELVMETEKCFKPKPSIFNCKTPPKISIKKYLERFEVFARGSQECFLLALIYMDRISEHNAQFVITPFNIHRFRDNFNFLIFLGLIFELVFLLI
jgi:hypothetical protein